MHTWWILILLSQFSFVHSSNLKLHFGDNIPCIKSWRYRNYQRINMINFVLCIYITASEAKVRQCKLCDAKFDHKSELKAHYRTIHPNEPGNLTRKRTVGRLGYMLFISAFWQTHVVAPSFFLLKSRRRQRIPRTRRSSFRVFRSIFLTKGLHIAHFYETDVLTAERGRQKG